MAAKTFSLVLTGHNDEQPFVSGASDLSMRNLINYLKSLVGGARQGSTTLKCRNDLVAASATVTCAAVSAADTVTIAGVAFTAVNGGTPAANEFDMSGSNSVDAAALAAAINASTSTGITGCVSAAAVGAVVTVTALVPGKIGNAITFTSSDNTRLAVTGSGRLASGAETLITFTNLS